MKLLQITLAEENIEVYINTDQIVSLTAATDKHRGEDVHTAIVLNFESANPIYVVESVEEIFDRLNELYRIDGVALPDDTDEVVTETPA